MEGDSCAVSLASTLSGREAATEAMESRSPTHALLAPPGLCRQLASSEMRAASVACAVL